VFKLTSSSLTGADPDIVFWCGKNIKESIKERSFSVMISKTQNSEQTQLE